MIEYTEQSTAKTIVGMSNGTELLVVKFIGSESIAICANAFASDVVVKI